MAVLVQVRRWMVGTAAVAVLGGSAGCWFPPPDPDPEPRAVLEITPDPIVDTYEGFTNMWRAAVEVTVTNVGDADDRAAPAVAFAGDPTIRINPVGGSECDAPLTQGASCRLAVQSQILSPSPPNAAVTGTLSVSGGPGTVGDSAEIIFHPPEPS